MSRLCPRCGRPESMRYPVWCRDCGSPLPLERRRALVASDVLLALGIALAIAIAVVFLNGCGEPFRAADEALSTAGASGYQSMPQAGAGGGAPTTQAGTGGLPGNSLAGMGGANPSNGGAAGSLQQTDPDAGAGASGSACLDDWEGSSCDTCSSAPAPASGRTCQQVLDCFVMNHCSSVGTCTGCLYDGPTTDAAAEAAERVINCKCGAP